GGTPPCPPDILNEIWWARASPSREPPFARNAPRWAFSQTVTHFTLPFLALLIASLTRRRETGSSIAHVNDAGSLTRGSPRVGKRVPASYVHRSRGATH